MQTRRRHTALDLALVVALAAAPAVAQPADAPTLLREGFAARRAHRDADALRAFAAAWALSPVPSTLAQVALAEQALGRWVDAERHLREALAADDPWVVRNRTVLRDALAVVDGHLGSLAVEGGPDGAAVRVDDHPVGTLPLAAPLRVPAGTVVLRVDAPGHHPVERRLTVAPRASLREEVALVAEAPPPPPPVVAPVATPVVAPAPAPIVVAPPPAAPSPVAPWVVVGAGGALLAGAAVFTALQADAVDSLRVRCANGDDAATAAVECAPDATARDLHDRAELYRDLSIASLSVGAAAAVGGLVWALVARPSRSVTVRATRGGALVGWSF